MTKRIVEFMLPFGTRPSIEMPVGSFILSVRWSKMSVATPVVEALCDIDGKMVKKNFLLLTMHNDIPNHHGRHVGSLARDRQCTVHVFEVGE